MKNEYVMVPVEPTPEMLNAACSTELLPFTMWRRMEEVYKSMLAEAPKPLRDVDLSTPEENGQVNWLDECDGMCGV